ncbi:MAG: NRDE family protein [Rhodothermales bacterium]
MCLLVLAHDVHPAYRLVLATNRDEFFDRPARPLAPWDDPPGIVAGRDLSAGGTWFGVDRRGRFGVLTNVREPGAERQDAPTRGRLVVDYLAGTESAADYLARLAGASEPFNGFNLIAGDASQLGYHTNREAGVRILTPGIYGLSNRALDTPWPKVIRGKAMLEDALRSRTLDPDRLLDGLHDPVEAPDDQLPRTGVPLEWERRLSAVFIEGDAYGTRCSTVMLVDREERVEVVERTYYPDGRRPTTARARFTLEHT